MNKIYKSIWNYVTKSWTAVSEDKRSPKKRTGTTQKIAFCASMSSMLIFGSSCVNAAWNVGETVNLDQEGDGGISNLIRGEFGFGESNSAKYYDEFQSILAGVHYLSFNGANAATASIDLNSNSLIYDLFEQSVGFQQILVGFNGGSWNLGGSFEVNTKNNIDSNVFSQSIKQNGTTIGVGYYTIGRRANMDKEKYDGTSFVDGDAERLDQSSDGRNTQEGIYTGAILARLDLSNDLSLVVNDVKTWATTLRGHGDIFYTGTDRTKDILNIERVYHSRDDVDDELYLEYNDYQGSTTVKNLTVNLGVTDAFGKTKSLTLVNSTVNANADAALTNINLDLNISDNSLLNLGQKSLTVGRDVIFTHISDLANNGVKASQINVASSVVLNASNGLYDLNTKANTFRVEGSNVEIASDASVEVKETDVVSGASLKASIDQLGETIKIENGQNQQTSTLRVTHSGTLTFDKTVSGDGVLHLDLSDGSALIFADGAGGENNSVLVRMSNATYTYDINDGFNRYVVGGKGKFISGSEALKLDTIGWQYNTEDSYGIIDLSKYEFDVKTGPAIDATNIHLSNGANIIQIDVSDFTGQSVSTTPGDILTLDAANPDRLLIKGTAGASGNRDITLQDPDGYVIPPDQSKPTYLISSNDTDGTERAAKLNWGIDASYHDTSESGIKENGIYLDYSVQTIQLLNGSQDDNSDMGTLRYDSALVANGTTANTDNSLESRLTGNGILEFGNSGTDPVNIAITNFFTDDARRNNYTGATVVRTNTTLRSMAAGLGNSTLVLIGEDANFDLYVADNTEDLDLHGITTDDAAHTITIDENGTLTLAGNTLNWDDLKALRAETAYNVDLQEGNVLGLQTQLQGEGSLVLISDLNAASARAFNSFEGKVTLSGDVTLKIGTGGKDTALTNGVFVSDGTATHVIDLKTGAQIGTANGVSGADFSGFKGILKLGADKTLDIYNMDSLGSSAIQADNGSSLVMNSISGELLNNSLTVLNGGTVTLNAKNSTGTLDYSKVAFDNNVGAFKLALENFEVTLTNSGQNISGNLSADLDSNSALNLTGSDGNVDWSNLTGDEGSTVFLENSSADRTVLTIDNISENFKGTSKFSRFDFTFGENSQHDGLLSKRNFEFVDSSLVADGVSEVQNLTLSSDSSLEFKEAGKITLDGKSSSLITVSGELNLGGATIVIDRDKFDFDLTEGGTTTTNKSLLAALNSAQSSSEKYFQLVDGKVTNNGTLAEFDETSTVLVKNEKDETVAEIGSGTTLINDDSGLWIGQGLQTLTLHQTMVLDAGDGTGLDLEDNGAFAINATIKSKVDGIGLTISGYTPILLNGAKGDILGTTTVSDSGHLILGATNALSTSGATVDVDGTGTLTVNAGVSQIVKSMTVDGTIDLKENSRIDVVNGGSVEIGADASLSGYGMWNLNAGAKMVIDAAEKGQNLTSGEVLGGTISKTGMGALTLGRDVVDSNDVAIDVTEGSLNIEGWDDTNSLTLKSLSLASETEFDLAGNLTTTDGFKANGATIWVGSRTYDENVGFFNRVIGGGYSGDATFIFNVKLGKTESFGDSLTINGAVADGSHAGLYVNLVGDNADAVKGLTLLKVKQEEGESVSESFATLANKDTVESGGFDWYLRSYVNGEYRDFYLTNEFDESNSDHKSDPTISVRLGSLAAFAASVDMFDMNIHDRQGTRPWINPVTGEKTMTSLWMRQTLSKEGNNDSSGQLSGDTQENVTMIGGDILQFSPSGNGLVYAGLMAGYGDSDYDGSSNRTSDGSKADTEAWMVGAYAGWNQNDPKVDRSGAYVSGWVQYAHFKSDITRTGSRTMEAKAEGISASLEAGWVLKAAEFQMQGGETKGAFYVEPHAQVTWWGADYDTINDEDIRFEGQHNITTRLGARFTMETSGATNFSPYLETNWVHNTKDYGAVWDDVESYVEGAGNQAELKFGAETFFTDSFSGYAQIRANWGGDGYNRQEGSLGLKYRF